MMVNETDGATPSVARGTRALPKSNRIAPARGAISPKKFGH
jgi:hypothetical protein